MKLYNTLTRTVQDFHPLDGKTVRMYVCGPTVYDDPHIGHARSAYTFDVLRRYLTYKGFTVKFVRNVTDVDDKIIEKAKQGLVHGPQSTVHSDLKEKCRTVAEKYLNRYHEVMRQLGIELPDLEPKATDHVVPEMTDFIAKLLIQGVAYEAAGDVYFAVRKFPGYGKLSNRALDELQAGARVEPGEHKNDPLDFALWKKAKPGEPSWNSPWGEGRPGWHIECSAMSTKYLGDQFDIHGGGVDLVFPHHENEIAQAEAAGKLFARFWIHNGLLTVNGQKMSKSLSNFITIDEVLAQYPDDVLKAFFLQSHYRSPADFSWDKLIQIKEAVSVFDRFFQKTRELLAPGFSEPPFLEEHMDVIQPFKKQLIDAMDDDLNTPATFGVLFELVDEGAR
ncbi:MAG: cysteine--tRNA ligase, partial [Candidatus Omnitrophica bacterium]|nr:cysteine--tRNA ligase [Candidatus Omnitrophota bacterium]